MIQKVVICDKVEESVIRRLGSNFMVVDASQVPKSELARVVADADGLVVRSATKVDTTLLAGASKLKVIVRAGVGLDNVDTEEAKRRGIKVFNTPKAPTNSAAELTIGLMFVLARKISLGDRGVRQGKWLKNQIMGVELRGKSLGIVGYGRIGSQVGRIATCLGMTVLAWDILGPSVVQEPAKYTELDELLAKSDFITLHVPLTDATRHFVNSATLGRIKKGAYIINASRGEVIDEDALYDALKDGNLAGAALDVFEKEPYSGRLAELDNVVITPHIGSNTYEAQAKIGDEIVDILTREMA